jgi:hypothetical protein
MWEWLTRERTWPLGESGWPSVGKGKESIVESRPLQGCSPRLYRLRTDGLVPMSKYLMYWSHVRDMSPVNRCSRLSTDVCLFPTASMTSRREKLGGDPQIDQPMDWGLCWEPFSQEQWIRSTLLMTMRKVFTYGLSWGHMCCMYQVSPIECTLIQIVVTLRYE